MDCAETQVDSETNADVAPEAAIKSDTLVKSDDTLTCANNTGLSCTKKLLWDMSGNSRSRDISTNDNEEEETGGVNETAKAKTCRWVVDCSLAVGFWSFARRKWRYD
jgi:superfamily II DNA helicase RecQ